MIAFDPRDPTVVTWGQLLRMTWAFWEAYCDEAFAILSDDFLEKNKTPDGFGLATLRADLKAVQG